MQNITFTDLVLARQSVRRYSPAPVEPEKIEQCLEAARLAPSASNSQPWKYIVVDRESIRAEVAKATFSTVESFNRFTLQAPVMVIIILEKAKLITRIAMLIKKKEWPLIDIGISASHFCLKAAELGLGTCMIGWFNEKEIKKLLSVPRQKSVALLISLGYPAEGYPLRKKIRKPMHEIAAKNSYHAS